MRPSITVACILGLLSLGATPSVAEEDHPPRPMRDATPAEVSTLRADTVRLITLLDRLKNVRSLRSLDDRREYAREATWLAWALYRTFPENTAHDRMSAE